MSDSSTVNVDPVPTAGTDEWSPQLIRDIIGSHQSRPGAMLPILHGIQDRLGYIPEASVPIIAEAMRQTRAEIHGIISFYHHFRTRPTGTHVLQVCRAEACQAMGGRQLESHIKSSLGIEYHQTSRDNEVTLEPVYCLGNCACAPSVQIGERVHGRMTTAKFDRLLSDLTTSTLELK